VNITTAICMEKVSSSQKPPPQDSSTRAAGASAHPSARPMVSSDSSTAMANALGTKRAEKRPRASAR
jgi:hypothetical protein